MKSFEVGFKGFEVIEAENLEDARRIFAEKHNKTTPYTIQPEYFNDLDGEENTDVIGMCEITGLAIFETDKYAVDNETGIMELMNDEEQ